MGLTALQWINFGLTMADAAVRGLEVAADGRDLVRRIVAEGRDPTDAEWDRINALSDALHARIQAAGADPDPGR
ncbi:hypothetical protein CCR85_01330 [Rhodothalassium salexigens]|uniref:hypothetical protein n=1 Tax=Rhodothalassium salexigens TaxID=1086 RepID=UPI001911C51B|nr:hypothetical protein [Rhodothalassium salexigens]MBK5910135.1 hypothetical protein [Rhodothalassium salexigens]MBK5920748.1 hypothetical protein [Rhodothalassium salexigens]